MHCGADLPEDQLICPSCGREIQIVPDYNPLDDMLTAQLKGGITQTMSVHLGEQEKQDVSYSGAANPVYERRESVGGETRCVGNSGSVGRRQQETVTRRGRDAVVRRSDVRPATGRVGQREDAREQTRRAYEEERRLRRMRAEKRKERARKKRRNCSAISFSIYFIDFINIKIFIDTIFIRKCNYCFLVSIIVIFLCHNSNSLQLLFYCYIYFFCISISGIYIYFTFALFLSFNLSCF